MSASTMGKTASASAPAPKPGERPVVSLSHLRKIFGSFVAVDNLSLDIARGEIVCLLGPSGCGKTTTLQLIAGFQTPTAGTVLIDGEDTTRLPPHRRNTGMVFQNYALFPHMSVAANIAFGLANIGVPKPDRAARIQELLDLVELGDLGARMPRELSGGQQQRVALARALSVNPAVLLLDEPFSNLDAQLRVRLRDDLRRLIQKVGLTTIFVTHDQEEALTMANRIVVMNAGRVEQVGSPRDVYRTPASAFVAQFIGQCTQISGRITNGIFEAERGFRFAVNGRSDGAAIAVIRPEHLSSANRESGRAPMSATVISEEFLGSVTRRVIEINGYRFAFVERVADHAGGEQATIEVGIDSPRVHLIYG
ncbi:MAG: ABC transporter ATP-binding protein [Pseudorhodoplanes sp.]